MATPVVAVAVREQVGRLKVPVELEAKLTVPVGVITAPTSVSVKVAVQLVELLVVTGFGLQFTVMEVARLFTFIVVLPELVACVESPL